MRFFAGGGSPQSAKKPVEVVKQAASEQRAALPAIKAPVSTAPVTAISPAPAPDPDKDLPVGVRYVVDLTASGRPRYSGSFGAVDVVEFRASGGGQVLDRFTTAQLWALGWSVDRTAFGAILRARDKEIIVTSWPIGDDLGQQSVQTTDRIRDAAGPPVTGASPAQPATAALRGSVIQRHARSLGTFPENKPYEVETSTPATTLEM